MHPAYLTKGSKRRLPKTKATNLRAEAMGRECQIRVPGVCSGDNRTVVLCHLPGAGMGRKHHDLHGAWGCYTCHAVVDGHQKCQYPPELLRLWLHEAVIRTQQVLIDEGVIRVGD